ncbi:hypothetical protein EGI26_20930 [Lacihabitans sp. CCS-44]|uniref:pirin family protein n=1 Tax=Lacihabitans sp. CCS-44 TaxID=2487331 RepID=UPI0020CFC4DF|nr:hypothetical protein [Lacihabitans sp. CCS-44]MCP9757635.1 hypothetical protein [Lacihabitans sp. CCS-44]
MKNKPSIIHWAESREITQTEDYRVLSSIPSAIAEIDKSDLLQQLKLFRDVTIAPQKKMEIVQASSSSTIFIPMVGGLEIIQNEKSVFVEPGQFYCHNSKEEHSLVLQNPYETEHINFIELCFASLEENNSTTGRFNLDGELNNLVELEISLPQKIYLGKFSTRKEFLINFEENRKAYFFVIHGSFEANGMLLHNRDSASFVSVDSLDFESLGQDSIALVFVE